jgi:hypothetical protein
VNTGSPRSHKGAIPMNLSLSQAFAVLNAALNHIRINQHLRKAFAKDLLKGGEL